MRYVVSSFPYQRRSPAAACPGAPSLGRRGVLGIADGQQLLRMPVSNANVAMASAASLAKPRPQRSRRRRQPISSGQSRSGSGVDLAPQVLQDPRADELAAVALHERPPRVAMSAQRALMRPMTASDSSRVSGSPDRKRKTPGRRSSHSIPRDGRRSRARGAGAPSSAGSSWSLVGARPAARGLRYAPGVCGDASQYSESPRMGRQSVPEVTQWGRARQGDAVGARKISQRRLTPKVA